MSIRKRKWVGPCGEAKFAWVVDFKDLGGTRRLRTFRLKKEADRFATKVRAELLDAELKAKGPASVGALPSHGSTNPQKDMNMNEATNTTAAAAKSKPTDAQIVKAMDNLMGDVHFLRRAAVVCDELASMEFRRSKTDGSSFQFKYGLTTEQVEGITYMLMHVRDLAEKLEGAWDNAFGLEGVQ